jgi:uncharacterized protein with PIN domain
VAFVLDASALLAYWLDELGAEVVTMAVSAEGAFVAPPNFAEALTKLVDRRPDLAQKLPAVSPKLAVEAASTLPGIPLAGGAISVEPFTIAEPYLRQAPTGYEAFGVGTGGQSMLGARSVPGSAGAHR